MDPENYPGSIKRHEVLGPPKDMSALEFESEYVFESPEHLQSAADIMPALTSF